MTAVRLPTAAMAPPATVMFAHSGRDWIRGSEQCLLDLVARLDRSAFRPLVLCGSPTLARAAERRGAPAVLVEDWGHGPVAPAPVRARVGALLRAHDVRLVHANWAEVLPAVIPAARSRRVPVVAHLHIVLTAQERLHNLVHQADVAVGVAEHVVAPLRAEDPTGARCRTRVIHNAVDAERLAAGGAPWLRAALGVLPGALVAASVGSLIHRKGHDVSIRAVALARAAGTDVHLLVCGGGDEAAPLTALAAELGVAAQVHFLGQRDDVGAVLRDAGDVYVTSARDEALPLNVLEAQWAGLPVVASDIPAHHEALVPGATGVLVPPERPDALAAALRALAADPARRRALGEAGRALVARTFSMDAYVDGFAGLYRELLAAPRGAYGWVRGTRWARPYGPWLLRAAGRRLGLVRG